ncbi:hypothetical protein BDQ17DRAFT_1334118 [Cyathus striatus]|nr:hypothetical protein BDQ17DRAFT_1334118 [Cyathus striatus]
MSLSNISLSDIRKILSIEQAQELYLQVIPAERRLPAEFWEKYHLKYVTIGLKASIAIYVASAVQVMEFEKFTISAVAINKDTPKDDKLWWRKHAKVNEKLQGIKANKDSFMEASKQNEDEIHSRLKEIAKSGVKIDEIMEEYQRKFAVNHSS